MQGVACHTAIYLPGTDTEEGDDAEDDDEEEEDGNDDRDDEHRLVLQLNLLGTAVRLQHTSHQGQSRSIKVNQGQSRSIKVNQGQSRSIKVSHRHSTQSWAYKTA